MTVLVTDSALPFLYDRYGTMLDGMDIYRRQGGRWVAADRESCGVQDVSEFPSREHEGYAALVDSIAELLRVFRPDILLRTTPAIHYGVDEAAVEAALREGIPCRFFCYQEYYGCGKALHSFPGTVLTADAEAAALLRRDGVDSVPIGWLSRLNYPDYPDIAHVRAETRARLSLFETDVALLYCATASGAFEAEREIFSNLASRVGQARLYLKLHPRNTQSERQQYRAMLPPGGICLEGGLSYGALLSFADYIVSPASAINVDALSYQLASSPSVPHAVSIYTSGECTRAIVRRATGLDQLPPGLPGHGSLILPESFSGFCFEKPTLQESVALLREAEAFLGGDMEAMIGSFLAHLKKGE